VKPLAAAATVVVVLIALFFVVPMIAGGSTNTCQALGSHEVSNAAAGIAGSKSGAVYNTINSVGQSSATGAVTTQVEANANPNSPAPVSCTYEYWKSII